MISNAVLADNIETVVLIYLLIINFPKLDSEYDFNYSDSLLLDDLKILLVLN